MSQSTRLPGILPWAGLALLVAGVHLLPLLLDPGLLAERALADGDGYLRLLRVRLLHQGGGWHDSLLPMLDAPQGTTSHWTRLLDVMILLPAVAFAPFLGFEEALYWAGALISPLLHLLTAFALAWAARPLLGREGGLLAGALTLAQVGITGYGAVGHADHHVLFLLLVCLAMGFLWRDRPEAAGFTVALAVWVGVEALAFAGLAMAVMGLAWISGEDRHAARNRALARGLFWGLAAALAVERAPSDWAVVEYDRISLAHLALAGSVLVFWMGAARTLPRTGPFGRTLAGLLGAGAAAMVLRLAFPDILRGPMAGIEPELRQIFFDHVLEFGRMTDAGMFLALAGGSVFALPWAAWRAWRERGGGQFRPWLFVALGLGLFLAISVPWLRWASYLGLFVALGLADLILQFLRALDRRLPEGGVRLAAKAGGILLVLLGPLAAGAVLAPAPAGPAPPGPDCRLSRLAPVLEAPPWSERSRIVLASANLGPEIAYRTRHRAVAALFHRGAAGIRDAVAILGAADPEEARRRIEAREIDLILLCPGPGREGALRGQDDSLYRRLVEGRAPAWAREIALPQGPGLEFRMFEVVR